MLITTMSDEAQCRACRDSSKQSESTISLDGRTAKMSVGDEMVPRLTDAFSGNTLWHTKTPFPIGASP